MNKTPSNRSFRLPRVWSNTELKQLAPVFGGEVINVSGWADLDKEGGRYKDYFREATAYYVSNYGGQRGADDETAVTDFTLDLIAPLLPEMVGRFDVVFNHTTLEHIYDVQTAFCNLCQMSRDVVIVIVPFAQEVHFNDSYGDFWRFTPMGLRQLYQQNGLSVIYEAATPDANAGIYLLFVGSRYPERWQGKLPAWEPLGKIGQWIGRSGNSGIKRQVKRLIGK